MAGWKRRDLSREGAMRLHERGGKGQGWGGGFSSYVQLAPSFGKLPRSHSSMVAFIHSSALRMDEHVRSPVLTGGRTEPANLTWFVFSVGWFVFSARWTTDVSANTALSVIL